MSFAVLADNEADADREDGHVFRVFNLLHNLVERQPAKGIYACCH